VREETHDDVIDRIVGELKTLPAVPADAAARVLARVDAARRAGESTDVEDDDVIYFPAVTDEMQTAGAPGLSSPRGAGSTHGLPRVPGGFRRRFLVSLPAAIGYALAATLAGFLIRGVMPRADNRAADVPLATETTPVGEGATTSVPVTPVASTSSREADEVPMQVQFVLEARRAKSVAVVGDFNAWDGTAHPLVRDSASGVWSTVVPVTPGRHVYAFLVDNTLWTLDPRAPKTRDADYGTEQSVLIVGVQ
jgi:hypothetical protein